MAVAPDADGTAATTDGTGTSVFLDAGAVTVGTGSNRALVVMLNFSAAVSAVVVVWDVVGANQSMTLIKSQSSRTYLFGLVAPASGLKTIHVAWTGLTDLVMNASSFTGVNQTGGATTFPNSTGANATSSTASVTVTSATGNAVIATHTVDRVSITSVNNTQIYISVSSGDTPSRCGNGNRAAGAASVVLSAALGASVVWSSVGTDIAAVAAAGAGPPLRTMMGAGR